MSECQTNKELLFFKELLNQCESIEKIKELCFSIANYDENVQTEWSSYINEIPNKRQFIAELLGNMPSSIKANVIIFAFAYRHGRDIYGCRELGEDEYWQIVNDDSVNNHDKCIVMACMIENCIVNANYYLAEDIVQELLNYEDIPLESVRTLMRFLTYTRRYKETIDLYNRFNSDGFLDDLYSDCMLRTEGDKKEYIPVKKEKAKNYVAFMNDCLGLCLEIHTGTNNKAKISNDEYPQFEFIDNMDFDSFVAYDVETSGLSTSYDYITEIGAIKVVDGVVVETEKFKFQELVHPYGKPRKISEEVAEITGITNEMVADARTVQDVFNDFADFIGDLVLVGYNNKGFDSFFLRRAGRYAGRVINNKQFDLFPLAKRRTNMNDAKLNTVANHFGIENPQAHRAYADAITTARLYLALKQKENIGKH